MMPVEFFALPLSLILWVVANAVTGAAYFHIPLVLFRATRRVESSGVVETAFLFVWFILACGIHHWVMLTAAREHPLPWYIVTADLNMMGASVLSAMALHHNRRQLAALFEFFDQCLRNRDFVARCLDRRLDVETYLEGK